MPPPLSRMEELWQEYQRTRDKRLREQIVLAYMPQVRRIARSLLAKIGGKAELDDLVNAGAVALLGALARFDPARGISFATWCAWRVLGAMLDHERKKLWPSETARKRTASLRRATRELAAALGHAPSDEDLAEALQVTPRQIAELRASIRHSKIVSLEASYDRVSPDLNPALEDRRPGPARQLLAQEAWARLREAFQRLPDRERLIIVLHYVEDITMADIAKVLEISQGRVSQLHARAIAKLKKRLGPRRDEFLDAFED